MLNAHRLVRDHTAFHSIQGQQLRARGKWFEVTSDTEFSFSPVLPNAFANHAINPAHRGPANDPKLHSPLQHSPSMIHKLTRRFLPRCCVNLYHRISYSSDNKDHEAPSPTTVTNPPTLSSSESAASFIPNMCAHAFPFFVRAHLPYSLASDLCGKKGISTHPGLITKEIKPSCSKWILRAK